MLFDPYGKALDECAGGFLSRPVDDAVKGLAGNSHLLCGFQVVEFLAIRQAQSFHLIRGKGYLLEVAERDARRLEICHWR